MYVCMYVCMCINDSCLCSPPMADKIRGVEMELKDCAFPLITKITSTTNYEEAFRDVDGKSFLKRFFFRDH